MIGVIGGRSLVGACLIAELLRSGEEVVAFSRKAMQEQPEPGLRWVGLGSGDPLPAGQSIEICISLIPIWVLGDHFPWLTAHGVRRVVALSSTSRFTKSASSSEQEQAVAAWLAEGEAQLIAWAEQHDVAWTILRPTLIYGFGEDKNVAEIARFIRRFKVFPLLGAAGGLRQPVHAEDVARACVRSSRAAPAANASYEITGADTISYRQMVERIYLACNRRPVFVTVPLAVFRAGLAMIRKIPRYRSFTVAMAERMNSDLVFDSGAATRDFGFSAREFRPGAVDVGAVGTTRRLPR